MTCPATASTCRPGYWPFALASFLTAACAQAQEWGGPFTLVPVSAPELVLEAVLPGTAEGNPVSINRPTGAENQTWVMTRRESNAYAIRPATSSSLVLAVAAGGTDNGTLVVLETDAGKPWQRWTIKANPNGSFSLLAVHAPTKGLDDLGGGNQPGARQDLWDYNPADEHLQWVLKPGVGATRPAEFAAAGRCRGRGGLLRSRGSDPGGDPPRHSDLRRRWPNPGHSAPARPAPRARPLPRRGGWGYPVRVLRRDDLEAQGETARPGRLFAVDRSPRCPTLSRSARYPGLFHSGVGAALQSCPQRQVWRPAATFPGTSRATAGFLEAMPVAAPVDSSRRDS